MDEVRLIEVANNVTCLGFFPVFLVGVSEAFLSRRHPTSNYFIKSTVCPTLRVIARLMAVPRTTMSLMSGAFGSGGDSSRVADLDLKL